MPTVPDNFVPRVDQSATNTPSFQAPNVEPMRNFAPEQIQEMGGAVSQAGDVLNSIGMRVQEQLDNANVKAAEAQFIQTSTDILHGDNGYMNKLGADALNGYSSAAESLSKAKQDALNSLSNNVQKDMFNRVAMQHLSTFGAQMGAHRAQQRNEYEYGEAISRADTMRVMSQNAPVGSKDHAIYIASGEQEIQNALSIKGIPANSEEATKAIREYRTGIVSDDVNRLMDAHDFEGAKTYFEQVAPKIDPSSPQVRAIQKQIQEGTLSNRILQDVRQQMSTGHTLEQMVNDLEDKYADNPMARSEATQELTRLYNIHRESQQTQTTSLIGQLWQMRYPTTPGQQAQSMVQIKNSQQWKDLTRIDGKIPDELISQWEQFGKRNENDPSMQAAKFATYWAYASNPDALKSMNDAQIIALMPRIGEDGVRDLLGRKQTILQPGKEYTSNIAMEKLKTFAYQAGIPAFGKEDAPFGPKDETGNQPTVASTLGQLKFSVDRQIESDEQSKRRQLTEPEIETIIKSNLVQFHLKGATRWAINPARWFGSTTDPAFDRYTFQLTPKDQYSFDIPEDQRQSIIDEARQNGVSNPTEEQIQAAYFQKRMPQVPRVTLAPHKPITRTPVKVK